MASTQLYIETTKIENETQLTFQTHKTQELITRQINSEYDITNVILIISMLIALGAMTFTYYAIQGAKPKIIIMSLLVVSLIYGVYAQCKVWGDEPKLQTQITQTIDAIHTYKEKNPPKDKK